MQLRNNDIGLQRNGFFVSLQPVKCNCDTEGSTSHGGKHAVQTLHIAIDKQSMWAAQWWGRTVHRISLDYLN